MKKICLALCCIFAFVGILGFVEVQRAEAVYVLFSWDDNAVIGLIDPQMKNENVFSHPNAGGDKPPMLGGSTVFIDVADRTRSQLDQLNASLGGPENKRYEFRFEGNNRWIHDQLYTKGFVTIKWSRIRGSVWDKKLKRFQTGNWRWASVTSKLTDECLLNCDYGVCERYGYHWSHIGDLCDCEEWQGKVFCHKKNFFEYSNKRDQN